MLQAISKAMSPAISSLLNPIQLNEYFAQEDTDEEGEMSNNNGLTLNENDVVGYQAGVGTENVAPPERTSAEGNTTPGSASTLTTNISEERLRQLIRENQQLKEQVNKQPLERGARALREVGKRPVLGGQDSLNHGHVIPKVEEIFSDEKFWPQKWHYHDEVEGSICSRVMSVVVVPSGVGRALYYQETVVPWIVSKWKNLKTNFYEKTRVWWIGKFDLYSFIIVTRNSHVFVTVGKCSLRSNEIWIV